MKGFMKYIATGCISFTFSCTFYLIFSFLGIFPQFNDQMIVTMLLLSIAIMLLIYLTHFLPIQNPIIVRLLELISVMLVLVLAGGLFKVFPFTSNFILSTISIGVLTYAVVIIVVFIGNQATATQINKVIGNRKKEGYNE